MGVRDKIKELQRMVGTNADGFWGKQSQAALIASGKKLAYKHGELPRQFGSLVQSQVDGFDTILNACNEHGGDAINPLYFAYMLATTWHETGLIVKRNNKRVLLHTMQPVEEMGKGRGRRYGKRIDIHGGTYSESLPIYYGRGYVQLTWLTNYVLMRRLLGVDFVNKPELALEPKNAANIMITGMLGGHFTGKSLSRYINIGSEAEFTQARRVINGTDKDTLISGYALKFLESLVIM